MHHVERGHICCSPDTRRAFRRRSRSSALLSLLPVEAKGLRKQALAEIETLIENLNAVDSLAERFSYVDTLMRTVETQEDAVGIIPENLHRGVVVPVSEQWADASPGDFRPYVWIGTEESLARALELRPGDPLVLEKRMRFPLQRLDFMLHELPRGLCGTVEGLAEELNLCDAYRCPLLNRIAGYETYRELGHAYLAYSRSGSDLDFSEWATANGKRFRL